MSPLADLAACLRFFSRLPMPRLPAGAQPPPPAAAAGMLPLAGALLGLLAALALALAVWLGLPGPLAAACALLAATLLTGGLHEDGLADTADGFGGGATAARKLAIMRDSRIGTYGVLAVAFSLALRGGALAALLERGGLPGACGALAGAAALSRGLALLPVAMLPPARTDGLGRGFATPRPMALAACAALAALLGVASPLLGGLPPGPVLAACGAALLGAGLLTRLARRQIGGQTGDVAGAAQQVAEAAYLLGLLVAPRHG